MKIFEWTPEGQSNRRLFLRVDHVVYVEGEEHEEGTPGSLNIIFWQHIFGVYRPDRQYRFLAKGGKATLVGLAQHLISDDVKNTILALDSDYDRAHGSLIEDDRIIYTHGYSWENDVFTEEIASEVFCHISHVQSDGRSHRKSA